MKSLRQLNTMKNNSTDKEKKRPIIELKDVLEYIHYCDSVDIPKLNMALTERVTRFIGEEDE